ncbi:hypothetical protein N658DRAFT_74058 [Parathielavia hyrcaniae]|uniref:Uncharacterized protein n=1 Tax=Parathielavia hyrcaniae TaxID=113614 RepID=A0AAN6PQJ1_9PEZI|nr:hypothetical protein N658DRAFT_74058 [Parathielavia hyrcaniae]
MPIPLFTPKVSVHPPTASNESSRTNFVRARSTLMDPLAPSDGATEVQLFHQQVRHYGHDFISFISAGLRETPTGLSITLETIEWPESQVSQVWFVGSTDLATEQAVLRFFQSDVGKRALGSDAVEFKLASSPLRLPGIQAQFTTAATPPQDGQEAVTTSESTSPPSHPHIGIPTDTGGGLPAAFTAADRPLQDGQEVVIASESTTLPHSQACVPAAPATSGWLQVSPHMHFSQVLRVKPRDQQAHADSRYLRGWLVDPNKSTVHGRVAAIVGAREYLVTPLADLRVEGET